MGLKIFFQQRSYFLKCLTTLLILLCSTYWDDVFANTTQKPLININNCSDLQNMRSDLLGIYQLTTDIDCAGFDFTPIGNSTGAFMGRFDGAGHRIKNLTINKNGTNYVGLFGATSGAVIEKLALVNANVVGNQTVGTLIGQAAASTIVANVNAQGTVRSEPGSNNIGGLIGYMITNSSVTDSSVSVEVRTTTSSSYMGGLIGYISSASVNHSYATGSVGGYAYLGGLAGYVTGTSAAPSSITDSYATGNINVTVTGNTFDHLGGLIGYLANSNSSIKRSYATGNVTGRSGSGTTGSENIGGLVGRSYGNIIDCYAIGNVTGGTYIGGLIGQTSSMVSNSFSTGTVTSNSYGGGLIGYTTSSATVSNSYWDTQTSGRASSAAGTGKITAQMYQQATFLNWDFTNIWNIHEANSYPWLRTTGQEIKTCAQLQNMSQNLNASFRLTNDIDCNGIVFNPVGTNAEPFIGSLEGEKFAISNLRIEGDQFVGLFGKTQAAYIGHLILKKSYVIGADTVGSLIGYAADNTQVNDVTVDGTVEAKNISDAKNIGGLIGMLNQSSVNRSAIAVTVNAPPVIYVGGLLGQNQQGQLINSYALGAVNGADYVAGLIGNNTGAVTNTYSTGAVNGSNNLGGLIAANVGTVTSSYWDMQTSKQAISQGGTGKTTAEMYEQDTYTGWDFTNIWNIFNGYTYPWLR